MKIKYIIPSILLTCTTVFSSTANRVIKPQQVAKTFDTAVDSCFKAISKDKFSRTMTDEQKIIDFNRVLNKSGKKVSNYVVVDKKNCQARVYTPEGKVIYKCEVALGRNIGDKRAGGYKVKGAELRAYTTPGEYSIYREGSGGKSDNKLYGKRVLSLKGDHTMSEYTKTQVLALHRVPTSPMGKLRENVFNNKTIKDNRVSFGCVNFLVESYDKMRKLIKGVETKVYILPEEKGNSLHLEKLSNGNYKFFQTKYRTQSMEPKSIPSSDKCPVKPKQNTEKDKVLQQLDSVFIKNNKIDLSDSAFYEY